MHEKRSDFLWIVQTIMIHYKDKIVGYPGVAGDAISASHRIPKDMTAREAALDFCGAHIEGFCGQEKRIPSWMFALKEPSNYSYNN